MATIYSRGLLYSDGIGVETGVAFDPTYRLGKDDQRYVSITGVGSEDLHVRVDHLGHLIEWLRDVQAADRAYQITLADAVKAGIKAAGKA